MQDLSRLREVLNSGAVAYVLAPISATDPDFSAVLCENDQQRLASMRHEGVRTAFLTGRRILHRVLGSLLSGKISVETDARGKPFCPHSLAPHFNLSHGAGHLAVVFCQDVPVGIDVEDLRRSVPALALARRYFSPREIEAVRREGLDVFFKMWTRKEAHVKAEGIGLARGNLRSVDVENLPGWNFHDFQIGEHVIGSLAYAGAERPVVQIFL